MKESMSVHDAGCIIRSHLLEMEPLFVEDAELTFVMRVPGQDTAYMIVGNDDLGELAVLLDRVSRGENEPLTRSAQPLEQ